MGKKSKPQSTPPSLTQPRHWHWWQLLVPAGIALLVAVINKMPAWKDQPASAPPAFALANPITRPDSGLVIIAQNKAAQREELLDIEFDGFLFASAAQRQPDIFPHAWRFSLQGRNLPDSLLADGHHLMRTGFAGETLSEYFKVGFNTQPPIVAGGVTHPEGKPNDRRVYGKVASKLQAPAETMFVAITIRSEGRSVEIEVPVKRIEFSGFIYFEFDTTLRGLSKISPQDPRYKKPFFAIRVTDQAGNSYSYGKSDAKFVAPADKRFTNLNDAELQRLPVELRKNITVIFRALLEAPPPTAPKVSLLAFLDSIHSAPKVALLDSSQLAPKVLLSVLPNSSQPSSKVLPPALSDSSQPVPPKQPDPYLSADEVKKMLKDHGLFDQYLNPSSVGITHQYKLLTRNGAKLVMDEATERMWQQGGSDVWMTYETALAYVAQKNKENFGGFSDWRLPTLLEAMLLMESKKQGELYLDAVFGHWQRWIWTSDKQNASWCWVVYFSSGDCSRIEATVNAYVRLVR
ncbi:DUF1566 domain-containing protein [candidate division KSB1 bacterium]|nr:DUF1566 domain-containing protein [candidate division KSB1 bacterium]